MSITLPTSHPFSLRQLQYAVAVAELLSFRKAAERCFVSQPSLSAQLQQLEDTLGIRLFERNQRRVLVTTAGRELLARAERVLREADDLLAAAKRAGDPLTGLLRIGVIPTVSPYLLPSCSTALRAAYGRLTTVWVEDKTAVLLRGLEQGSLDAALLALTADVGDVEYETVAIDPFVLATGPADPLGARDAEVRLAELRDAQVLLLDDGHCFRDQALAFCTTAKARELEFRATSLPTLAQMVASGMGVTLLPRLAVATEAARAQLLLRRFAQPAPHRTLVLLWRKGSPLATALRQVAQTIREAYPSDSLPSGPPATKNAQSPARKQPRARR